MAQKLEVIKAGGGSVKVGATGTISSLMNRELNSVRCTQQIPTSSKRQPPMISVSVPCDVNLVINPKRLQPRISSNEASSSSRRINYRYHESTQKTRCSSSSSRKSSHLVPMLGSDGTFGENTSKREKSDKKVSNIVEVVDLKCGNPSKWSNPIANRLKKLGFSKISETIS